MLVEKGVRERQKKQASVALGISSQQMSPWAKRHTTPQHNKS
jgi:hypothetical protein